MGAYAREVAADRLAHLATQGLDVVGFFQAATEVLATAVPRCADTCWETLDPASFMLTGAYGELAAEAPPEILVHEYLGDDVLRSADIARSELGVTTLHDATGGDPRSSQLFTEFFEPAGIEHVAAVALRTADRTTWGICGLARGTGEEPFTVEELAFLTRVAPSLADGTRRGLLVGEASDPETIDAPGLVVLADDWTLESATPGVERWLEVLPGERRPVPACMLAIAVRASRGAAGAAAAAPPTTRVLTTDGRWVVLHGLPLSAGGSRRVAVIVEPAGPARITPLLMAAYGLTSREQEVTRLVLRGESTATIATTLSISPHTVQEHLKRIFEKTGVRSRRDLVGKVFTAHYEPRVRDNERRTDAGRPHRGGPFPVAAAR